MFRQVKILRKEVPSSPAKLELSPRPYDYTNLNSILAYK